VASAQVPTAAGVGSDAPHVFVLELDMPTPYESFEYRVFTAIDSYRVYPKEALFAAAQGLTTVVFDYLDGKASNVSVVASSKNGSLDNASRKAVSNAVLPQPPAEYAGKTLHMVMYFCYSLNGRGNCPATPNVISVHGTLIERAGL
jgi:outer membrane biosynthesis protein TonB